MQDTEMTESDSIMDAKLERIKELIKTDPKSKFN